MLRSLITPLLIALCAGSSFYYTTANQKAQAIIVGSVTPVRAGGGIVPSQSSQPPPPPLPPTRLPDVDAMIVIDNSGSMFGHKCGSAQPIPANDRDQLRIQGADIVIGSLAADLDPRQTSLGLIAFGDKATLLSPLTPLSNQDPSIRSNLAAAIKNPRCDGETNIVGAIQMALAELRSKRHTAGNVPVIVFLTDGNPTQGGYFAEINQVLDDLGDVQFFAVILGSDPQLDQSKQFWNSQSQRRSNVIYHPLTSSAGIPDLYNEITTRLNQTPPDPNAVALPPGQHVTLSVPANVRQMVMKVIKSKPQVVVQIQDPDGKDPHNLPPERFRALLNNSTVEVYVIGRPQQGDWVFSVPDGEQITVLQPEYRSIYQVQLLQPDSLGLLSVDQPTNLVVRVIDMDTQQPITGTFKLTGAYRLQDQPENTNQPITMTDGPLAAQYNVQIPTGAFTEGHEYTLTFEVQDDVGLGSQPTIYQLPAGRLPVITSFLVNPLLAYDDQPISLVAQVANADVVNGTPTVNLAPLPGVGSVAFQSKDVTSYNATVPPLTRPGTYALSVSYRGKTTAGRDFNSTSSVAVTVREREWKIWLRYLAFVIASLTGAFLVFRFVLLSPLIPIFQKLGISPSGYVRTTSPGSTYPNEEVNLRDLLRRKRKLRTLTLGVDPRFDIRLEEPPDQSTTGDDDTTPPKRPSLRERFWGPKASARITRNGGSTVIISGSGAGSAFSKNGVSSREVEENTVEYSLKSIVNPDDPE